MTKKLEDLPILRVHKVKGVQRENLCFGVVSLAMFSMPKTK